ncbi:MAG: hypothetical protein R3C59_08900 [Planctomycetaceae bacterium]
MREEVVELRSEFRLRGRVIIAIRFLCQHGFGSKNRFRGHHLKENINPARIHRNQPQNGNGFGRICRSTGSVGQPEEINQPEIHRLVVTQCLILRVGAQPVAQNQY